MTSATSRANISIDKNSVTGYLLPAPEYTGSIGEQAGPCAKSRQVVADARVPEHRLPSGLCGSPPLSPRLAAPAQLRLAT